MISRIRKNDNKSRQMQQEKIRELEDEVAGLEKGRKRQMIHRFQLNVLLEEKDLLQ